MSQYGNEYTQAVNLARQQLAGGQPTANPSAQTGNALDVLLEALSGIPADTMFAGIADAVKSGASMDITTTTTTPPPAGGGGGGGGGGGTVIAAPTSIQRTATEASAPVVNTGDVLTNAVNPNVMFNIGAVAAIGVVTIIGELLSIGQIDRVLEPLLSFLNLTDAPTVFEGVRNIRLRNQVLQPYEYYVNEQNPISIPPYADLIRLRVREDREGNPLMSQSEFEQQMKYLGFAKFWSGALWDAHFTLPSNMELFTMYNYGIITYEQLHKQLIVNDIAPEWVDRITQIAKRYPSMPELRMMARRNPMPTELVESALRAQGIKEEFFPYFVAMFNDWDVDSIQKRRQTRYISSYEAGILSDDEFQTLVADTGVSTHEGEELLKEAQWRRYDRRLGERQKTIIKLLQKNLITRDEAEEVLTNLGFEPIDIDHWLDYAVATMGFAPTIEAESEEGIEGLETPEERTTKFAEWEELTPPIFYPTLSEPSTEE